MNRRLSLVFTVAVLVATGEWLFLYCLPVASARPHPLTITFFDVGQGDSFLLQQGERQLLVDGGPNRVVLSRLGQVLPYLDRDLDTIIATHPHDDHTAGLEALFGRYRIDQLLLPESHREDRGFQVLRDQATAHGTAISTLQRGHRLWLTGSTVLTVLWPPADCLAALAQDDPNADAYHHSPANSCSVVMRLDNCDESGCRRALLAGDATAVTERLLLRNGGDRLAADLLKVGHHGSRYSSTPEFVQAVSPAAAVIQTGQPNRFGHPDYGVILRLQAAGAAVYRNDRQGTVTAFPAPRGFRLQAEKAPEPDI